MKVLFEFKTGFTRIIRDIDYPGGFAQLSEDIWNADIVILEDVSFPVESLLFIGKDSP